MAKHPEQKKRRVEVVVISDVHLGTYGCHAEELLAYLKSIKPKTLILNGDIIDIWQFSKSYWPATHMRVVRHLISLMSKGVKVYYITGNHDEMLRRFAGMKLGSLQILNKVVLELTNGQKAWFFHGDVFDVTMQHSKWLARLGAVGYDTLILLNRMVNYGCQKLKRPRMSFSKSVKNRVKSAVKFINNFESTCADLAAENGYDYVVCGHIHQPEIKEMNTSSGKVTYLNSGDWVENLTALEYNAGSWSLYQHSSALAQMHLAENTLEEADNVEELYGSLTNHQLFENLLAEFNQLKLRA